MVRSGLRNRSIMDLNHAAFKYNFTIVYKGLRCVDIGSLSVVCPHCQGIKFKSESSGLCCAGGKVKLPVSTHPPEPLYSFLYGNTTESKYFFANIQKYNGCFQMTPSGAEVVDLPGYNPSFKVMASHYYKLKNLIFFQITCKHSRFKVKFTIERALWYHHQMKFISSYKFISLVIPSLS